MGTDKKIKFAVVGCGHIGKRHVSMIQGNEHFELVALCDVKPKDSLDLGPFAPARFFSSIDELLSAGLDIDAVAIASPNGNHEEQALKVLGKNYHVVVEKPMALTKAGCERIIFKALQKHKQVFCVMQNRYSPPSVWLKDILEQGVLGKRRVSVRCWFKTLCRRWRQSFSRSNFRIVACIELLARNPIGWQDRKPILRNKDRKSWQCEQANESSCPNSVSHGC